MRKEKMFLVALFTLIRYAEVLLMKAEALIWQGKNGDGPLNEIRARAGLSPKTWVC